VAAPRPPPEVRVTGTGRLALDTRPWTKVYLDGRFLGDTPLDEVAVPAGHLRLRAVNEELHLEKTIEVDVAADQTVRLRRDW
jgi:serine/threonine-protein kinase